MQTADYEQMAPEEAAEYDYYQLMEEMWNDPIYLLDDAVEGLERLMDSETDLNRLTGLESIWERLKRALELLTKQQRGTSEN